MTEPADRQQTFIRSLEGIGDILVFETERKSKNKTVIEGLGRLKTILETFFALREKDPDRFDELMLDPNFRELSRTNPREAGARLLFFPGEPFVSFTVALQQIRRIHEQAIASKNDEISRQATVHLVWILQHLTTRPHNESFVQQLLMSLNEFADSAIRNNDRSMYSAAINWYVSTIFQREFRLEYVDTLTGHFRSTIQQIIQKDQWQLYQSAVSSLMQGFMMPADTMHNLWEYEHLWIRDEEFRRSQHERGIRNRADQLTQSVKQIGSVEEYETWVKSLEDFDAALAPYLPREQKEAKEKLISDSKNYAAAVFKFNALRKGVFALGALMVRERRPNYIQFLWEFKQPQDAEAVWVGHDVTPTTLVELVSFYFGKGYFEWPDLSFGDHHGSRVYFQRYFLLLAARLLAPTVAVEDRYPTLDSFALPSFSIYQLSNVESSVGTLIEEIPHINNDPKFLEAVGFPPSKITDTFEKVLPAFLAILKQKAKDRIDELQRITPLDEQKVATFRDEAYAAFEKTVTVRRILAHFGLFLDLSQEGPAAGDNVTQFAIAQIDNKAAFFTNWHVLHSHWGENYGQGLALSEDNQIVKQLLTASRALRRTLQQALAELGEESDPFLICNHMTVLNSFQNNDQFLSRWAPNSDPLEVPNFQGWFTWQNRRIPLFASHMEEGKIAVVDAKRLGRFTLYPPGFGSEPPESRRGHLAIMVRAYSDDPTLLNTVLDHPPNWLAEKGDRQSQTSYLLDKVLVEVMERFTFILIDEPFLELVRIS